ASKETWVKAVLPWRTWMRNQWIMAAGVKRQLSHHEWPAWRQAWWMKSQPSLAARSCLRVLRVVEIRRCIAGPPGPWWVRKIPLCTGVPLFSRDEAAWGYRCLNAIQPCLFFFSERRGRKHAVHVVRRLLVAVEPDLGVVADNGPLRRFGGVGRPRGTL